MSVALGGLFVGKSAVLSGAFWLIAAATLVIARRAFTRHQHGYVGRPELEKARANRAESKPSES